MGRKGCIIQPLIKIMYQHICNSQKVFFPFVRVCALQMEWKSYGKKLIIPATPFSPLHQKIFEILSHKPQLYTTRLGRGWWPSGAHYIVIIWTQYELLSQHNYRNDCSVRTGLLCSYTACWQAILTILGQDWQLLAGKQRVYESDILLGTFFPNEEFDGKLVQNLCPDVSIWHRIS